MADSETSEPRMGSTKSLHDEVTTIENAPLLHPDEEEDDDMDSKSSFFSCSRSATTAIGLVLLLAMLVLTVLSVFLQRYSSNKYIDIIIPSNGSLTNGTEDTTEILNI